jgi:redox-sensing transcriptional repressor
VPLEIPEVVIDRLPVYFRFIARIAGEGRTVISSQELGDELDVTPAQIRKDLSYFGRFGKQGRGYSVQRLLDELRLILGLDRRWSIVVVGIGRLGRAVASYPGFEGQGFDISGRYDTNPELIGSEVDGDIVRDVADLDADLRQRRIDIGVVTVTAPHAQEVVDVLTRGGVRAILNYTPTRIQVPDGVELKNINPVLFLQSMTYHLKQREVARQAMPGN